MLRTAVILAGGAGLRLRPLTADIPKCMVRVAGKPLLQWVLEWLINNGVTNCVIGVAYQKEKIIQHFGEGKDLGASIVYSTHTVEGGTAEGFRLAISRCVKDEHFVAMNGDELVNVDLANFATFHLAHGGVATMAVAPLRSPFGVVDIDGQDVIGFREKPTVQTLWVSIGTYIFSRSILDFLPTQGNIEQTVFPKLAAMRQLKAFIHKGFWATINTAKDLEDVERELTKVNR